MDNTALLRPIVQRLINTPIHELPRISGFLASAIAESPVILEGKDGAQLLKLKTRLSALLQDRNIEGRFTAAILIKSLVEHGNHDILAGCEAWARGLLACLNRPDPAEVRKVYLLALSRIFILSASHQTLLREIASPILPSFITTTLSIIKPISVKKDGDTKTAISPMLLPVVSSWSVLLPYYTTIFRSFVARIKPICLSILEPGNASEILRTECMSLLSLLHLCAPKNSSAAEWNETCASWLHSGQDTASLVFRSIVEEWKSCSGSMYLTTPRQDFSKQPASTSSNSAGLKAWSGISEGCSRLITCTDMVREMMTGHGSHPCSIPFGDILDLTARVLTVDLKAPGSAIEYSLRLHPEVGREEKEELWSNLPRLHVACIRLLQALVDTFQRGGAPLFNVMAGQVLGAFAQGHWHGGVREASYNAAISMITISGSAFMHCDQEIASQLLHHSCRDLLDQASRHSHSQNAQSTPGDSFKSKMNMTANTISQPLSTTEIVSTFPEQPSRTRAAWDLVETALRCIPSFDLPASIRTELDRTSILLTHHDAIFASTMNPATTSSSLVGSASLLPFLAQTHTQDLRIEAILRPRMPVIRSAFHNDESESKTSSAKNMTLDEHEAHNFAAHGTTDETESIPNQTNGLGKHLTDLNIHTISIEAPESRPTPILEQSPLKRNQSWMDYTTDTSQTNPHDPETIPQNKKPRTDTNGGTNNHETPWHPTVNPETEYTHISLESTPAPQATTSTAVSISDDTSHKGSKLEISGTIQKPIEMGDDDDDDSSDFEIPTIDIDPSSDEDEEEDEEVEFDEEGG